MALKSQGTELFYQKDPATMVKISKLAGVNGTGGPSGKIDITDLDSVEKEAIAGLPDPGAVAVPLNFDPSVTVHQDLFALWQAQTRVKFVIGFSDGTALPTSASGTITFPTTRTFVDFLGYIADFPLDAPVDSKVTTQMSVQRSGPKTPHWKT